MAEEADLSQNGSASALPSHEDHQLIDGDKPEEAGAQDMDLEPVAPQKPSESVNIENQGTESEETQVNDEESVDLSTLPAKRTRECETETVEENRALKKQQVERSMEEERLEQLKPSKVGEATKEEETEEGDGDLQEKEEPANEIEESAKKDDGEKETGPVSLGPKVFNSSVEMFDYFVKFLHYWPPDLDINKYEQMVLLDLLKKGHPEADQKIGGEVCAFQVRIHPMWKSRCFFVVRSDGSYDDFSFRKCIDRIIPLPENMKIKKDVDRVVEDKLSRGHKRGGSHGSGGGRGGGRRGRGRGAFRK